MAQPHSPQRQLLVSRADAARMLGNVSVATITRLQVAGRLTPRRLNPRKPRAPVYYPIEQILAIAQGR